MAYTATTTVAQERPSYVISLGETEAGAATEATITTAAQPQRGTNIAPTHGRIVRIAFDLGAGTGTTMDPAIGSATSPATVNGDQIWLNGAAAAKANIFFDPPRPYYAPSGLFWRSVCDAGADNVTTIKIYIEAGLN